MKFFTTLRRSRFWSFFAPIARLFVSVVGDALLKTALSYVEEAAADSGLTNDERREFVAGKLRDDFGDDIKERMLNLAIEFAVAKLKGSK